MFAKKVREEVIGQGRRSSLSQVTYAFDKEEKSVFTFDVYRLRDSAAVLPLDDDDYVYLLKEFTPSTGVWQVGLARGGIETAKGETAEDGARRELKEELGLACESLETLWAGYMAPNASDWYVTVFLGRGVSSVVKEGGDEMYVTEVVKIKLGEAVAMVLAGRIPSAVAGVAILAAARKERA